MRAVPKVTAVSDRDLLLLLGSKHLRDYREGVESVPGERLARGRAKIDALSAVCPWWLRTRL